MTRPAFAVIALAALVAVFLRLSGIPTLNFSALGGLAVLCGAALNRPFLATAIVLGVRLLTDAVLETRTGYGWYSSIAWDYGAYALIVMLAARLRPRHLLTGAATGLLAAATFFTVSNFGVWVVSRGDGPGLYSRDLAGLVNCYTLAVPFARGTFLGDIGFSAVFILAWQLAALPNRSASPVTTG